jgi:hypothetical protein
MAPAISDSTLAREGVSVKEDSLVCDVDQELPIQELNGQSKVDLLIVRVEYHSVMLRLDQERQYQRMGLETRVRQARIEDE